MEPGFKRAAWVKESIVAGNGFHAMKQDPVRHNALNIASALGVVIAFCGLIALGGLLPPWIYIPLAAPLFGSMFFSGFILVIHECSHNMFLLFKDRDRIKGANRLVGCCSPTTCATGRRATPPTTCAPASPTIPRTPTR